MSNRRTVAGRLVDGARATVNRAGFDLSREHFRHRFVPALEHNGVDTVLDIGANTGQFGQLLRRAGFSGRIVSVEPLAAAHTELAARAARDVAWTTLRAAVSDRPSRLRVNVAGNSVSSSVLPILDRHTAAAPQSRYVGTEDVPATTVDELVERFGLATDRTLLKIDVQGYEQAVLDGAGRTLDGFRGVRSELSLVALYDGQALLAEIVEQLGKHGFELWHVEPGFTEPGTGRLLQLDGVFFRTRG